MMIMDQALIVQNTVHSPVEVELRECANCVVGYVLDGRMEIHSNKSVSEVSSGMVYCLGVGAHYVRRIPTQETAYRELMFHYPSEYLQELLLRLSLEYHVNTPNMHTDPSGNKSQLPGNYACAPAWDALRRFFDYVDDTLRMTHDPVTEKFQLMGALYLIVSGEDDLLRQMILSHSDPVRSQFIRIVSSHIFDNISIEDLARECNRSLTSFKKEFQSIFHTSPHQWFLQKRLYHARQLLISTDRSISEVGTSSAIPNPSHFIKLFRKQYGITPALYRSLHRQIQNGPEKRAKSHTKVAQKVSETAQV